MELLNEDNEILDKVVVIISGDITGDGKIDSIDVLRVRLYLANKIKLKDYQIKSANVNSDTRINSVDVLRMRLYIAGKIVGF